MDDDSVEKVFVGILLSAVILGLVTALCYGFTRFNEWERKYVREGYEYCIQQKDKDFCWNRYFND